MGGVGGVAVVGFCVDGVDGGAVGAVGAAAARFGGVSEFGARPIQGEKKGKKKERTGKDFHGPGPFEEETNLDPSGGIVGWVFKRKSAEC